MVTVPPTSADDEVHEDRTECSRETPHAVAIEIRTESEKRQNAAFPRKPYRVATCHACGRGERDSDEQRLTIFFRSGSPPANHSRRNMGEKDALRAFGPQRG